MFTRLRSGFALMLCLLLAMSRPGWSQEHNMAVLIVGNTKDKAITATEQELKKQIAVDRARLKLSREDLPIISYHIDKPQEKEYCEEKLGIKDNELPFVGIVQQQDLVAKKVLYKYVAIKDTTDAALKTMARVAVLLKLDPTLLTTAPSPTPATTLSLKSVAVLNGDNEPQNRFFPVDENVCFVVHMHNERPAEEQRHVLTIKITDANGNVLPRTFGGPFHVNAGEDLDNVDLVARSDPERRNGMPVKGLLPQTYGVAVELDGEELARTQFQIAAEDSSRWAIAEGYVADQQGNRKYKFSATDYGVYVYVRLRSRDRLAASSHQITVTLYDPQGKVYGRPLGGPIFVKNADELVGKTFPVDADKERHNGFLIQGSRLAHTPGQYRFVVDVDGKTLRVLTFRVTTE